MQSSTPMQAPPSMPAASCKPAEQPSSHVFRVPDGTAPRHFTRPPANQGEVLRLETAWNRSLYHDLFSAPLDIDTRMET